MMNNILSKCMLFAAGAAIGSAVTWKLLKVKYERIAQEEIDSVKEFYSIRHDGEKENVEVPEEYYDCDKIKDEKEAGVDMKKPYVISPDDYDTEGYDTVTLYYYEDGVLEDMLTKELIDDVDDLIGEESLTHFGEYEDDSVFVRNDHLKTDFEILLVSERYGG